jgi:hypothetical protein
MVLMNFIVLNKSMREKRYMIFGASNGNYYSCVKCDDDGVIV